MPGFGQIFRNLTESASAANLRSVRARANGGSGWGPFLRVMRVLNASGLLTLYELRRGNQMSWIYTELRVKSFVCWQKVTRVEACRSRRAYQASEPTETSHIAMTNASPGSRDSPLVPAATPSHWAKTQTLCQLLVLSMPPCRPERTFVERNTETVRICMAIKEFELSSFQERFSSCVIVRVHS